MDAERRFWTQIDFLNFVVSVCACIIFLIIVFQFIRRFQSYSESRKESTKDQSNLGRCSFPDCVRCRQHKSILMRARTKLTYCQDEKNNAASAFSQLLDDIQASYQNLISNTVQELPRNNSHTHNPLIFRLKGIRAQPVWDLDEFPGILSLSDHSEEIRAEINHLMYDLESDAQGCVSSYWKVNDTPLGKWSICHLVDQGAETKAVAAFPVTWRVVNSLPCIMKNNLFGNVAFSVVEPGTKIEAHCGPTNIRIRCHLGLCIPRNCQLKVADSVLEWTEDGLICFDESYLHHVEFPASKDDSQSRLVLIVDLWHPDITDEQKSLIDYSFSPES